MAKKTKYLSETGSVATNRALSVATVATNTALSVAIVATNKANHTNIINLDLYL